MSYEATQAERELAVYQNTFSKATLHPKIPDGKCTTSVGQSLGSVMTVKMTDALARTSMLIVYPGLNSCCKLLDTTNGFAQRCKIKNHANHKITPNDGDPSPGVIIKPDHQWNSWRTVSCGIELTSIRSSSAAQGWWEAIAVPIPRDEVYFTWEEDADGAYSQWEPSNKWFACGGGCISCSTSGVSWADNEYYQCGPISDLNKHRFECIPTNHDHPFNQFDDAEMVHLFHNVAKGNHLDPPATRAGTNSLCDPDGIGSTLGVGEQPSENLMEAINRQWDQNHRVWLISFHHEQSSALSELLVQAVNNEELIASCGSAYRRFHTESASNGADVETKTHVISAKNEHVPASERARQRKKRGSRDGDHPISGNPMVKKVHASLAEGDIEAAQATVLDHALALVETKADEGVNWWNQQDVQWNIGRQKAKKYGKRKPKGIQRFGY